jgi:hypothetical protein
VSAASARRRAGCWHPNEKNRVCPHFSIFRHFSEIDGQYRGAAFDRVKPKNRQRLESTSGIRVLLESNVVRIAPASVELEQRGRPVNDVLVCAGGELPTAMLKSIGILVETHFGTAPARLLS